MRYPTSSRNYEKQKSSTSNRGMSLEDDINTSNQYYLTNGIGVLYKKPTPITIVKVDYPNRASAKITEAYFKVPSTTDYNGIYKGRYLDFEAKECNSRTAFPFTSIHPHQIRHLKEVLKHGAIAFIIMRMHQYDKDYLIKADQFIDFYETANRKSLPYSWIKENAFVIERKYNVPCNYLKVVEEQYKF